MWLVISLAVFVALTIAAHLLRDPMPPATTRPSGWASLLEYFQDWGAALGFAATVLVAFAAYWAISDVRHFRALESLKQFRSDMQEFLDESVRGCVPSERVRDPGAFRGALLRWGTDVRALERRFEPLRPYLPEGLQDALTDIRRSLTYLNTTSHPYPSSTMITDLNFKLQVLSRRLRFLT